MLNALWDAAPATTPQEVGARKAHRLQIRAMQTAAVEKVRRLQDETLARNLPQVDLQLDHALHAGMYQRTILLPAGTVLAGALIKIPTLLIVHGEAIVHTEDGPRRLSGYTVLTCEAHRKQAFVAIEDTHMTMVFPTGARTVEEAEREFTDEWAILQNNRGKEA